MVNLLFSTFAVVTGVASGFPSSDLFSCGQDTNGLDRKPGDFWMEDCNACICQNDNVKSCTRKLCGTDQLFCEDSNRQVKKEGRLGRRTATNAHAQEATPSANPRLIQP